IPNISGEILFFGQPYKNIQKKIVYVPQRNEAYWNCRFHLLAWRSTSGIRIRIVCLPLLHSRVGH
ncbi:MAG: peptide transporter, partial [Candidatus Phytoplasma australasiaticum]|nr:peptide transporter [Candidatus Phytoplasma australasiaticum]